MRTGRNTDIEDGMGFSGLVPSPDGQAVDRMFDAQRRRIRHLEETLRRIDHEVAGVGPHASADFMRLALHSVQEMARAAATSSGEHRG